MIDVCNVCNFKCVFCPTSDRDLLKSVGRKKGMMSFSFYQEIIDSLGAFDGKITVLSLHKDGEPLLNKNIADMVAYAKKAKVSSTVEITTNASRMFPDLSNKLIAAGLDSIRISIEHVSAEGYQKTTRNYKDYDQIVQNVSHLYHEARRRRSQLKILVKIIDTGLSADEMDKFYRDFGGISDIARVEGIMGWSYSELKDFTLGINPTVGMDGITPLKPERIVCPEPFKMLAINFDGSVSPCCDDWTLNLVLGNMNQESAIEIWNGARLSRIRELHLKNRRGELAACAKCQYMLGVTDLFDLDRSRDALSKKLGYE
ncbi:radical SAM protein [uncultured Thiodictyon sp.]|uniref:radical SAM/SPASM domain-containing protein n=1 Tax=uncultured Thiodictyon sp. TaxID=1846217 RepID=UPI0025F0B78B|nr:radical SAM protein [uncultured Thiodictyon sp.]